MNTCFRSGLGALALLALAGCASGGGVASVPTGDVLVTDTAYMANVEEVARRRGVDVQWIAPPLKRLPRGSAQ